MKKLYKKTYHTVLYTDLNDGTIDDEIERHLTNIVGFSCSSLDEVKSVEDLPFGWNASDYPSECVSKDGTSYYECSDLSIEDILQESKSKSLEEENKNLKAELEALKYQLNQIKRINKI